MKGLLELFWENIHFFYLVGKSDKQILNFAHVTTIGSLVVNRDTPYFDLRGFWNNSSILFKSCLGATDDVSGCIPLFWCKPSTEAG